MPDTEEQFRETDRAYFDLLGRQVAVGNQIGVIIEYSPAAGPTYWFTIRFPDGNQIVVHRDRFFVLPNQQELTDRLEAKWIELAAAKAVDSPEGHCKKLAQVVGELLTEVRL